MSSNVNAYAASNYGYRRSRAVSDSSKNNKNLQFAKKGPPPFGAGWKSETSFDVNTSFNGDENRHRSMNRNLAQQRGRFYSDACSEADKDKVSSKGPMRFGAGWSANGTFHGESRRDGNSSQNELSFSNHNRRGGSSDNRNVQYESAKKTFHQMDFRGRIQSDPCHQQYQVSSQNRGVNSQRARNHSVATHTYNQERSNNREHNHGRRSASQKMFENRRPFVNDGHNSGPKQSSSDWKMPREQDNHGRMQESHMQNYYPSAGSGNYGRSSYTNNIKQYARAKTDEFKFSGTQNFVPTGQNQSFRGNASNGFSSQYKNSQNRKSSSGAGRDANTAFHQDDFCDSDWANKAILPKPSDRQQRQNYKTRGKSVSRQNGSTSMHARYGNNKKATAMSNGIQYCPDESSVFNQTVQGLSETIAEDVSIAYGNESSVYFDGDSTVDDYDDDVFETTDDTTERLDTSVLPTKDIQDTLNAVFKTGGVSSKPINTISFNNQGVDKKKLFHKKKSQLNQSFAGFENHGPSPILEVNEETDSPMVNRAKGVTPLRNIANIDKSLLEDIQTWTPVIHSPRVQREKPYLLRFFRNDSEDENLYEFQGASKSHENLPYLLIKEVERFHELKRSKSCDTLADTVSFGVTRDTTTMYDRWDLSIWRQELPFKQVASVAPTADWRCATKMDKMALPFDPKKMTIAGRYIVHRGFVSKMPYMLVVDNKISFHNKEGGYQLMPPQFEFDLLPYLECCDGEVVPGLYEFLDKNQEQFGEVYYEVARMTRVVNKAPKKIVDRCRENKD